MQDNLFCTIKPFLSLFEVKNTLIIGSGTGGYLPLCTSLVLEDVLLVEADSSQIEKMYKMHNLSKKYRVENSLIATDKEAIPFYVASYKKLSGTQKLKKYKMIMPNISLVETQELKAESLDSFIQRRDTAIEFLIIDTYTASDILKEGSKALESVQILMCSTLLDEKDTLVEELEQKGFKKVEIFMDNNPAFITVLLVRDYSRKIIERKDFFENKVEEIKILKKKNIYLKDELEKIKSESDKNFDLEQCISDFKQNVLKIVKESASNTVKQLEAYQNINNFLNFNTIPLNFHGWPISTDIAEFLLQKMLTNDYDIVLEFGSGTSTFLFAQIIQKLNINRDKQIRQIAFDHHEKYYQQTKDYLKVLKLEDDVDLNHAPLVSLVHKETEYKYYDCNSKFEELKSLNINNLLVLVDGPPGNTCKHARFPAILYLIKLAKKGFDIDIVLDDYYRQEEKEISEMWESLLKEKKINFKSYILEQEKGTYFLSIKGEEK